VFNSVNFLLAISAEEMLSRPHPCLPAGMKFTLIFLRRPELVEGFVPRQKVE
jgi:hypothetical protein